MSHMSDLDRIIADLKNRRLDLGLTQREVGIKSGIGQNLICVYERRRTISPSLAKLAAWADALDCDITVTVRPARRDGS